MIFTIILAIYYFITGMINININLFIFTLWVDSCLLVGIKDSQ